MNSRRQLFFIKPCTDFILTLLLDTPNRTAIQNTRCICSIKEKSGKAKFKPAGFWIIINCFLFFPFLDRNRRRVYFFSKFYRIKYGRLPKSINSLIKVVNYYTVYLP